MRLVDDETGDPRLRQAVEEAGPREPFGRHVEELEAAEPGHPERLLLVGAGERGVDVGRPDVELAETVDLVLHECDEGGDHDCKPVAKERWHPVADRLPGAGRSDRQHVPPGQLGLHDLDLPGPERLQPEDVVERLLGCHGASLSLASGTLRAFG